MNIIGHGGLNEVSRKTCKSLEAAVAASKNPGNIAYYEPPEQTKKVVKGGELQKLQKQINSIQKDIDQCKQEILDIFKTETNRIKEQSLASSTANTPTNLKQVRRVIDLSMQKRKGF